MRLAVVADEATFQQELAAALGLVARTRSSIEQGALPDLDPVMAALERIDDILGQLPAAAGRRLRPSLMALLDEIGTLTSQLARERARLAAELRDAGAHRHAESAYRRARRL